MNIGFDYMVMAAGLIWIMGLANSMIQERKAQEKRFEDLKQEKLSAHQADIS
tara:strand:+ start:140 stop:295 length:156 start_codon:yes stop_codon:yes gene_type:complete